MTHPLRTKIGNLLVSTVYMANNPIRGDHWETMVFRYLDEAGRRTNDWAELYCQFTADDVTGHVNGVAWAEAHQ